MSEIEETVAILEKMINWHHLAGREPRVLALIADWRKRGEALERIERWFGEFPPSGSFWDEPDNTRPMSYGACWGSNGERDYMRAIARSALPPKP